MLTRIRIWHVVGLQLLVAALATAALALFVDYPDVTRRPTPPPKTLFFALIAAVTVAAAALAAAGMRSPQADTALILLFTIVLWLVSCYALAFVWINTFGA